jgi:hypothetical protein
MVVGQSDSKPIEPLAESTAGDLFISIGPPEESAEHRALEKEAGFGYRLVLGDYRNVESWLRRQETAPGLKSEVGSSISSRPNLQQLQ